MVVFVDLIEQKPGVVWLLLGNCKTTGWEKNNVGLEKEAFTRTSFNILLLNPLDKFSTSLTNLSFTL